MTKRTNCECVHDTASVCFQLFYHLQKEGSFPEPRAVFYAAEMAMALGYLHSLDIVYRYTHSNRKSLESHYSRLSPLVPC